MAVDEREQWHIPPCECSSSNICWTLESNALTLYMCYVHFMSRFIPFGIGYLWLLFVFVELMLAVVRWSVGCRSQVCSSIRAWHCATHHIICPVLQRREREEGTHNDNVLINLCVCTRQVETENHSVCNINWINDKTHRFKSIATMMIGFVLIGDRVIVCKWAKSVIRCKTFCPEKSRYNSAVSYLGGRYWSCADSA